MHVLLLGDVLAFCFFLFATFAAIFVAAFAAAMASAPAMTLGEESDLVEELRARVARIGYEATYSRVMREVETREAKQDAEWEAEASNVSVVETAAPVASARPPRGLVRPPTAEMRAAWARLSPPDEGFVPVVASSRTKVWDDLGVYSPFPPVVEWPGHTFPMTEGAISCS